MQTDGNWAAQQNAPTVTWPLLSYQMGTRELVGAGKTTGAAAEELRVFPSLVKRKLLPKTFVIPYSPKTHWEHLWQHSCGVGQLVLQQWGTEWAAKDYLWHIPPSQQELEKPPNCFFNISGYLFPNLLAVWQDFVHSSASGEIPAVVGQVTCSSVLSILNCHPLPPCTASAGLWSYVWTIACTLHGPVVSTAATACRDKFHARRWRFLKKTEGKKFTKLFMYCIHWGNTAYLLLNSKCFLQSLSVGIDGPAG